MGTILFLFIAALGGSVCLGIIGIWAVLSITVSGWFLVTLPLALFLCFLIIAGIYWIGDNF